MTISAEYLKKRLIYYPDTGIFIWKPKPVRPEFRRVDNSWNSAWAGEEAGAPDKLGYIQIMIDYKNHKAHRLAWLYMTGEWPEHGIDHKDGDPANNRFDNLRPATQGQNHQNKRRQSNNTSGFTGVYFSKGKWQAEIKRDGKKRWLGSYLSAEDANAAYLDAKRKLHSFQPYQRPHTL